MTEDEEQLLDQARENREQTRRLREESGAEDGESTEAPPSGDPSAGDDSAVGADEPS